MDRFDTSPDDYVVTCTQRDDDACATDPALGRCPACGYVEHDIPRASDTAHDDLCCGQRFAEVCTGTASDPCLTHTQDDDAFNPTVAIEAFQGLA